MPNTPNLRPFDRILIANRAEIAVRVMRTAHALGYKCVAVYSAADADAPHVRLADDAVLLGPGPANESYLDMDRVLAAAHTSGAQAIHPGYGFLSENADFARHCESAGITFIGPRSDAVRLMGNKALAKRRMIAAGVPCVPGYEGADQSDAALARAALDIGYPVMVKAAAGGGGRGMRRVNQADALIPALSAARNEAHAAFGSDELILEKLIVGPRHVEIQVFADQFGHVIHLGERDCSVQRRHQKIIEEAPCPIMTESLREAMGSAAVEAARAIDYLGAGTVEFLLDAAGNFHFLEMNTRLQVEHPVTEMITGLDLVALQLQVATGEPLGIAQADVRRQGHAMEARLYAEDASRDFLPSAGRISHWQPAVGEGVRIDSGIESGLDVSPYYDPMLAKIIAHGPDRETARARLRQALEDTAIFGPTTNRDFLCQCLETAAFAAGSITTEFVAESLAHYRPAAFDLDAASIAAVLLHRQDARRAHQSSIMVSEELTNWSNRGPLPTRYDLSADDLHFALSVVSAAGGGHYEVRHEDTRLRVQLTPLAAARASVRIGDHQLSIAYTVDEGGISLAIGRHTYHVRKRLAQAAEDEEVDITAGARIRSPMHGKVLEVMVSEGDRVREGQCVVVIEAMKMQHQIFVESEGTVIGIRCTAGAQVADQDLLLELEIDPA